MPRAKARAVFELAGQWIAAEPGRRGFYRFWNDAGTGRVRRASLGTEDLETAKRALAEIIVRGAPRTTDTALTLVLEDYFTGRTDHLASNKFARHAGKLFLTCWGPLVRSSVLTEAKQREFVEWCIARGYSMGYVERLMGVLQAALNKAKLPIDIVVREGDMLARWPLKPKATRKAFIPTDAELARFFRAPLPDNLRRWALNAMATAGRPGAVLELSPTARQRQCGLIDLNPEGRRQNKKYRACVREPRAMAAWLNKWEKTGLDAFGGRYSGYASTDSIDTALHRARAREDVNLPRLSVYSFRHAAASAIRAAGVSEDQLAYQLGHRRPETRTTRSYGEFDPRYLADAAAALNAWILRVHKLAKAEPKAAAKKKRAA